MAKVKVNSSNIDEIEYNFDTNELSVWFKSRKNETEHYVYENVSSEEYGNMIIAESAGKFFHANIKSKPVRKAE